MLEKRLIKHSTLYHVKIFRQYWCCCISEEQLLAAYTLQTSLSSQTPSISAVVQGSGKAGLITVTRWLLKAQPDSMLEQNLGRQKGDMRTRPIHFQKDNMAG